MHEDNAVDSHQSRLEPLEVAEIGVRPLLFPPSPCTSIASMDLYADSFTFVAVFVLVAVNRDNDC